MNDHQTWSMKLWYKYWILTFLNTVKQSNLLGKKRLMGCHPAQFYRNHKKLEKISNSQTWSRKDMLTMYDHETWSN